MANDKRAQRAATKDAKRDDRALRQQQRQAAKTSEIEAKRASKTAKAEGKADAKRTKAEAKMVKAQGQAAGTGKWSQEAIQARAAALQGATKAFADSAGSVIQTLVGGGIGTEPLAEPLEGPPLAEEAPDLFESDMSAPGSAKLPQKPPPVSDKNKRWYERTSTWIGAGLATALGLGAAVLLAR